MPPLVRHLPQNLLGLGIDTHSSCLDVGAGTGSLSGWLVSVTASVGQVTAVDRDARFLGHLSARGARVVEADITDPGFEPGRFDLVHARFVLMHLHDREEVLRRQHARLVGRAGGGAGHRRRRCDQSAGVRGVGARPRAVRPCRRQVRERAGRTWSRCPPDPSTQRPARSAGRCATRDDAPVGPRCRSACCWWPA
ncbi:class I SAM-dependent methyltransferase [Streptomyces erythrochromogenes]|uniref:class I SAM-dependent methyltransferase n=1 Tax=Streptomyces erythrochromogenes TaxID=285574 RepID=UPI00331DBE7E